MSSADVCFARGAQFFTLRERCHGHNLRLTTSHVVDADRKLSAAAPGFYQSPRTLWMPLRFVLFVFAQKKLFPGCGFQVVKISCALNQSVIV